jgi:trk system potassium uptake protein TrkH
MKTAHEERLRLLDRIGAILGTFALLMLLLRYGFPAVAMPRGVVLAWSTLLPLGFFFEAGLRLLWVRDPWRHLTFHPWRYVLSVMVLLELAGIATWSLGPQARGPRAAILASELTLTIGLLGYLRGAARGAIHANRWLAERQIPIFLLPAAAFGALIIAGAFLLALPGLSFGRRPWIDHLFTATSAVCVTGLTAYDVATTLRPIGKGVLALLIQLGGIGALTLLGLLGLWVRGGWTARERIAFGELVGGAEVRETRNLIRTVFAVTICAEILGTVALWRLWDGRLDYPILTALFHAISAFCNAGFTLFHDSLSSFRGDPPVLVVVMGLVLAGGLGFPVLAHAARSGVGHVLPWVEIRPLARGLRQAVLFSGLLVLAGAAAYLADGWIGGSRRSVIDALFQSVSTRTAGFEIEPQRAFLGVGFAMTLILMAIGAGPQSTGGGMKTSVVLRIFGRPDAREEGARSSLGARKLALLLAGVYLSVGLAGGALLALSGGRPAGDAAFEAFSALGTVGLSRGMVPEAAPVEKLVLVLLMFSGRVLFPTFVATLVRRRRGGVDPLPWA